jgi:hypothetical protein
MAANIFEDLILKHFLDRNGVKSQVTSVACAAD